jgi:hypothetical protein
MPHSGETRSFLYSHCITNVNVFKFLYFRFGADNFLLRETIGEVTQYVNSEFELNQVRLCFY